MENSSNKAANHHWLEITEKITVASSIGVSIICIFLQKSLYASLLISASLLLNLVNRQRLLTVKEATNQVSLGQVQESDLERVEKEFKAKIKNLAIKLENLSEFSHTEFSQYKKESASIQEKVQKLQQSLFELDKIERDLDTGLSGLNQQQVEMSKLVQELRILGHQNPSTNNESNSVDYYYNKGLICQDNGNVEQALENYSKAIELDNNYAPAYYNRGLAQIKIEQKRQAIEDLRKASQLYFENQDLDKYNQIKSLIQKLHDLENSDNSEEKISVIDLFV